MTDTSASLLDRVRNGRDDVAWGRLQSMYTPLIRHWLNRHAHLDANDADDVVQDVMAVVFRRIGEFERQRSGSFRTWLRMITLNCLRSALRKLHSPAAGTGGSQLLAALQELEDPASQLSEIWDREHDRFIMQRILEMLQNEFAETTWRAFQLTALEGQSADDAARRIGITTNAVFIARSRVLARMRQEAAGLID